MSNLWLCVAVLLELWWSWSPKFGTKECMPGVPAGPGIVGHEQGRWAQGWSWDVAGWVHTMHRHLAALPGPVV